MVYMSKKWKWIIAIAAFYFLYNILSAQVPVCKENGLHDTYYFLRHDIWEPGKPPLDDCPGILRIPHAEQ